MSLTAADPMVIPTISLFSFVKEFKRRNFYWKPDEFGHEPPAVEAFIRGQPDGRWVGLDVRAANYFGYSYAKQTIREPIKQQLAGLHGGRRLVIIGVAQPDDPDFYDGIEMALREEQLPALLATSRDDPVTEWRIIGELIDYLQDTFYQLLSSGEVTTAEFSEIIGESIQNANIRLRRLWELGLIQREKIISPSGGRVWTNRVL